MSGFDDEYGCFEYDQPYRLDMYGRPQRGFGDGRWVDPSRTRTKSSHPYTYDEFFIFGNREIIKKKDVSGIYSDRVWEWWLGEKKTDKGFDDLWKKHVGTRYELASSEKLSAFFTAYNQTLWPEKNKGKSVQVVALAEGCNPSNGYPYWVIWFVEKT